MTQAIILAAGNGRRLYPYTKDKPKCLIQMGTKSLIEHQIDTLKTAGIDEIIVVTGHKSKMVKTRLGSKVKYVYNRKFATTNNLYSLWCATPYIKGDFIVSMADSIFHQGIIQKLLSSKKSITTMVDNNKNLDEEAFKAVTKNDCVKDLGRNLDLKKASGEFLALTKFSNNGVQVMLKTIKSMIKRGDYNKPTAFLIKEIMKTMNVSVKHTNLPWIEIDTETDLKHAIGSSIFQNFQNFLWSWVLLKFKPHIHERNSRVRN